MYYGNPTASTTSNASNVFLAYHGPYIQSTGNYDDSGTLISFTNISSNINVRIHYNYLYQAQTCGRTAHISTIIDDEVVDDNEFRHPCNGIGEAKKDDLRTYNSRDFKVADKKVKDEVRFDFNNGDYRVRIADIRISKYSSEEPSWSGFGEEKKVSMVTTSNDFITSYWWLVLSGIIGVVIAVAIIIFKRRKKRDFNQPSGNYRRNSDPRKNTQGSMDKRFNRQRPLKQNQGRNPPPPDGELNNRDYCNEKGQTYSKSTRKNRNPEQRLEKVKDKKEENISGEDEREIETF